MQAISWFGRAMIISNLLSMGGELPLEGRLPSSKEK